MNFHALKKVADGILSDANLSHRVTSITSGYNFETSTHTFTVSSGNYIGTGSSINEASDDLACDLVFSTKP